MQILLSGKGITLTESMKEYIEIKIDKLGRFWKDIVRVHVEVSMNRHHKHGNIFIVYAWVEAPGNDIRVSTEGMQFQTAVDDLRVKLERLILKSKEKISERS